MIQSDIRPLDLELTPSIMQSLQEKGYSPSNYYDVRRMARLRICPPAVLEFTNPLPAFPRPNGQSEVIIKDMSKPGVGLLYDQQLWPGEEVTIYFQGRSIEYSICRCQRVSAKCYIVGGLLKNIKRVTGLS